MEVKTAGLAVVNEPNHVLLAGIAVAGDVTRRPREELEGALCVERVRYRRGRVGAVHVEVEVAHGAPVARANPDFLTAVALEGELRVLESQPVLGVAEVKYLGVFHDSAAGQLFGALPRTSNHGAYI